MTGGSRRKLQHKGSGVPNMALHGAHGLVEKARKFSAFISALEAQWAWRPRCGTDSALAKSTMPGDNWPEPCSVPV